MFVGVYKRTQLCYPSFDSPILIREYSSEMERRKRLVLIRHGETDYNLKLLVQGRGIDSDLNQMGKLQAKKLGLRMKKYIEIYGKNFDAVCSSSLKRAMSTASIILSEIEEKQEIRLYDGLCEVGQIWKEFD